MALCQFRNVTSRMVILRCVGPEAFFQEKVIFPFEEFQWSCPPESRVDIWAHSLTGADLVESFPAEEVAISCDLDATEESREVEPAGGISTSGSMLPHKGHHPAPRNSRSRPSAAVDSRRTIEPMRRTEPSRT